MCLSVQDCAYTYEDRRTHILVVWNGMHVGPGGSDLQLSFHGVRPEDGHGVLGADKGGWGLVGSVKNLAEEGE